MSSPSVVFSVFSFVFYAKVADSSLTTCRFITYLLLALLMHSVLKVQTAGFSIDDSSFLGKFFVSILTTCSVGDLQRLIFRTDVALTESTGFS